MQSRQITPTPQHRNLLAMLCACLLYAPITVAAECPAGDVESFAVSQYHADDREWFAALKNSLFLIKVQRFDRVDVAIADARDAVDVATLYALYAAERKRNRAAINHNFADTYLAAADYPTQAEGFLMLGTEEFFIHSLKLRASGELASLKLKETGFNPLFKKRLKFDGDNFVGVKPEVACRVLTNFMNEYRANQFTNAQQYELIKLKQ